MKPTNQIDPTFATFLNALRLAAALDVFLAHMPLEHAPGARYLHIFSVFAHTSVIVFFVLSGYLIALAAPRDGDLLTYAINRATRIYSVALPAIVLSWAIACVLQRAGADTTLYGYELAQPWKYIPLFLTFTSESWSLKESLFADPPFWSLAYEVWYYVLFGICYFIARPAKWLWVGAVLLVMGPKLWLLLPIWLLGVGLRRLHTSCMLSRPVARWLFLIAVCLLAEIKLLDLQNIFTSATSMAMETGLGINLHYSRSFVGDYFEAIPIAMIIFAARDAQCSVLRPMASAIAAMTSVSFSLYLYHFPLFAAFETLLPGRGLLDAVLTLAAVGMLGVLFERRRDVLRQWLWQGAAWLRSAVSVTDNVQPITHAAKPRA